jgi:glycosyltransferase AglD
MMSELEVSAVLPVYNDKRALESAIPQSIRALSSLTDRFEIIVAEDGSKDGSAEFVQELALQEPRLRLLHSDQRLGRGKALTRAIHDARGSIVCYYDVDLATSLEHLGELIGSIQRGFDISTGSRLIPGSTVTRSGEREIASRGYNQLVRGVLGSRVYDHQCGFKAFNRSRILPLLPRIRAQHWFWDTELLVRAQGEGYRICEFPVRWYQGRGTTVKVNDVIEMGSAVFGLWWHIHVSKT